MFELRVCEVTKSKQKKKKQERKKVNKRKINKRSNQHPNWLLFFSNMS